MLCRFALIFGQNDIHHWETVVQADTTWAYFIGNEEPPTNWHLPSFNDNSWPQAQGSIGFGDNDDATVIEVCEALYLRINFDILDTLNIAAAVLHADYDDAFVAYWNGHEIARENIGTQGIQPAFDAETEYFREARLYRNALPENFLLNNEELQQTLQIGTNTLAIQVHNDGLNSLDLSSHFFLSLGITDTLQHYSNTPNWFVPPIIFKKSDLPILKINTNNIAIVDEPRILANLQVIDNQGLTNYVDDIATKYDGQISIEMRGSSSQTRFPKKSYRLETQTNNGENNNVSLLGLPAENDWILYGPYSDKSLLRNVLMFDIGRKMGHYTPRTRYCELLLNEKYQGVYVLMENIKRDKNRVHIEKLTAEEEEEKEITGGYILKLDKRTSSENEEVWYSEYLPTTTTDRPIFFQYHYPKPDEITSIQKQYIQNYIHTFESQLYGENFKDEALGYRAYIDVPSFIDFLLANELSYNVDGMRISTFMYKKNIDEGGKLYMGPLWDFNLAFGNGYDCNTQNELGFLKDFNIVCPNSSYHVPFWWNRLLEDERFANELKCTWQAYRKTFLKTDSLFAFIDSQAEMLREAQTRNFTKWPIIDQKVWPNVFESQTYEEEIAMLKTWLVKRLHWLDTNLWGDCMVFETIDTAGLNALLFPSVSRDEATLAYLLTQNSYVNLHIFDATGRLMRQVLDNKIKAANYYEQPLPIANLPKGLYFVRLKALNETKVLKFVKQ